MSLCTSTGVHLPPRSPTKRTISARKVGLLICSAQSMAVGMSSMVALRTKIPIASSWAGPSSWFESHSPAASKSCFRYLSNCSPMACRWGLTPAGSCASHSSRPSARSSSLPPSAAEFEITDADPIDLSVYERKAVLRALHAAGGNRTRAAAVLGVGKSTLYRKLTKFGLV